MSCFLSSNGRLSLFAKPDVAMRIAKPIRISAVPTLVRKTLSSDG